MTPGVWSPHIVHVSGVRFPIVSYPLPSGNLTFIQIRVIELLKALHELVIEGRVKWVTFAFVIVRDIIKGILHMVVRLLMTDH